MANRRIPGHWLSWPENPKHAAECSTNSLPSSHQCYICGMILTRQKHRQVSRQAQNQLGFNHSHSLPPPPLDMSTSSTLLLFSPTPRHPFDKVHIYRPSPKRRPGQITLGYRNSRTHHHLTTTAAHLSTTTSLYLAQATLDIKAKRKAGSTRWRVYRTTTTTTKEDL